MKANHSGELGGGPFWEGHDSKQGMYASYQSVFRQNHQVFDEGILL